MATANGPEKKLTLDEAAEKIAAEYPSIFDSANERILFKEDFKLLVRTYVMEPAGISGFQNTMQRRFASVAERGHVKKYDAKAKEAGGATLLQLAKDDAATRSQAEVDNTAEVMETMAANPALVNQVIGDVLSKMMKDMQKK